MVQICCLNAKFGCMAAGDRKVKFYLLCACFFPDWMRCAHSESCIVTIYRLTLLQFSAFLEEEIFFSVVCKLQNYVTRWRHKCR